MTSGGPSLRGKIAAIGFVLPSFVIIAGVFALPLVLLLGVRPLAKALLKKREDANRGGALPMGGADGVAMPAPVSAEMLGAGGVPLGERVGLVRDFTRDNPARAALAVRDMIKAEGN